LSKKNVPKAKFIKGDFSKLKLKSNSVDAIVSFYAIFHIPRSEHKKILKKMHNLLRPNGYLLITLGFNEMKMDVGKFVDSKMAWSSYSAEKNKQLVEQTGFKIKLLEEEHHDGEHHLWILAQKATFK
jgi:ubiquinone/menaquinone biosynthesis C-methylase UbiE